jgi:hypothetical protein
MAGVESLAGKVERIICEEKSSEGYNPRALRA